MPLAEFKEYYKSALQLEPEDFDEFISSIERPLPSTFRVTNTSERTAILQRLSTYKFLSRIEYLDDVFTFDLKERPAEYAEFVQFLVGQTDIGNIQRQEIVSMLPHLFLDLKRDSTVLETCASPGSKTKQLLDVVKDGLIVSNDKSFSRANVLISESFKKANSNFLVTVADASQLPNVQEKFDRICCDVPCSSDGTMRKNIPILQRWNVRTALGLHPLQYRILERSLENLSADGLLVYSTCSLNPVENECVINRILETGKYELILDGKRLQYSRGDPSKILVRKGITKFVHDKYPYENPELSKCVRILPHDQNTGGFFIATLRRKVPGVADSPAPVMLSVERKNKPEDIVGHNFYRIPSDLKEALMTRFPSKNPEKQYFISLTRNYKNIFCISEAAYNFIAAHPKLRVPYAGVKAFSLTDLADCSYRAKSAYMELVGTTPDVIGNAMDFEALIKNKDVDCSALSFTAAGHFSIGFDHVPYKFCGFAGGKQVFLYIDANHRKGLANIYTGN